LSSGGGITLLDGIEDARDIRHDSPAYRVNTGLVQKKPAGLRRIVG
jgi:hypothetical protein